MPYTLRYKAHGGRKYFTNEDGEVAIADLSIRDENNPETTDDGLVLIDQKARQAAPFATP